MSRKNIFKMKYAGPSGAHLACLTETSMYGECKNEAHQSSIHPTGRHNNLNKKMEKDKKGNNLPITAPRNPNRKGFLARAHKALDRNRRATAIIIEYVQKTSTMTYSEGSYKIPGTMKG